MKLNINFDLLKDAVEQMGGSGKISSTEGIEINFDDIDINFDGGGLFEYEGKQIFLFLPRQFKDINLVKNDYSQGNKFHVSDCSTLQQQRERGTFNNYSATNNLSGKFHVYGFDNNNERDEFDTRLNVCQNCLRKLNYKNCNNPYVNINEIVRNFDIGEFFETYSTLFEYLPNFEQTKTKEKITYTDDWETISKKYKDSKKYICETCDTSFINHKHLLHTHHKNGIKTDNSLNNLKAVCIDCHRKEPNHRHVYLNYKELQQIYINRREQNKIHITGWKDVFKFTDLSLHGYLHLIENKYTLPTDIAYILEHNGKKIALDFAWITNNKKSAVVTEYTYDLLNFGEEWNILTFGDAIIKETQNIQNEAQSAIELQAMMNYTTQIETILESMGAKGRGLHGKVTKVQKKLSKDVVFRLRRIATIRNKKMHQAGFNNYVFADFEKDCKIVLDFLNKL